MTTGVLVDWLSCTFKKKIKPVPFFQLNDCEMDTPRFGYRAAYKDGYGTVYMDGDASMGTHCVWSGDCLNQWRAGGTETLVMIEQLLAQGAKITRLDLAIDCCDLGLSIDELEQALIMGVAENRPTKWSMLRSQAGGQTLYLGSRSSERMLRVYNKYAQLASRVSAITTTDWIRVEVELKDEHAASAAKALTSNSLESVIRAQIDAIATFPYVRDWQRVRMSLDEPCAIVRSSRGKSNTDKWLLEVVAPVLYKRLQDDEFREIWYALMTD